MDSPARPSDRSFPRDATLGDLGEFALIDLLTADLQRNELVFLGPGDDAAVVRTPRGHVVVSTDVLVEGKHFRREWGSAEDLGHRAAAQNLADIAAMGGRASAVTIGLAAPPALPVAWVVDLMRGFAAEVEAVGASVVGGDLSASSEVMIAVTVIGACDQAPVTRSGAQVGDQVALCGRQGWSAGGLAVLGRGFRSPRVLVEAFCRPTPPYAAGPAAAIAGATAMIDVSDGLVADAGHIAEASGVALNLRTDRLVVPEPLHAVGAATGIDPVRFVLTGGEDHSLVATFPRGSELPEGFSEIGEVAAGAGVTVDGEAWQEEGGHTHFGS
ncbi:MAG: thiamine-phosphate kinase [Marmoricola sp.]